MLYKMWTDPRQMEIVEFRPQASSRSHSWPLHRQDGAERNQSETNLFAADKSDDADDNLNDEDNDDNAEELTDTTDKQTKHPTLYSRFI